MLNIYLYPSSAIQKEKRYLAYILRELLFVARRNLLGRSVYEHMGLQLIMTPPDKIDTTSLLTILGVIAAVWALITPNARLRLRFCLAWWDWAIIVTSFIPVPLTTIFPSPTPRNVLFFFLIIIY
ncbi:hypothetical protein J9A88_27925, partial [Klebsiella pneumoniae]